MNNFEELGIVKKIAIDNVDRWYWNKNDAEAFDILKWDWENCHKPSIANCILRYDVVIQAGGNQGMYPRLYSDMFQVVYTFEPEPTNFFFLTSNCQKHNIIKFQAALADQPGTCHVIGPDATNHGMHYIDTNDGAIPVLSIDSFIWPTVNLIHLDVEGFELKSLQGAKKTIETFKPIVFCERYENPEEIIDFLEPMGYKELGYSAHDLVMGYLK